MKSMCSVEVKFFFGFFLVWLYLVWFGGTLIHSAVVLAKYAM